MSATADYPSYDGPPPDAVHGTVPPQSIESEQGVLGAVLLSDRAMYSYVVESQLKPDDFYRERHRVIFNAMVELYRESEPIDVLTVTEHLRARAQLDAAGGQAGIDELTAAVPAVGNLKRYGEIVKEMSLMRRLLQATYEIQASVHGRESLPKEIVEQAERAVHAIAHEDSAASQDTTSAEQLGSNFLDWLADTSTPVAIPTGFRKLDNNIGQGLRPGDMTIVSGWTNMGKSPLIDGFLYRAALAGRRVHLYSNEISETDRTARMIAMMTGVSMTRMQARDLTDREWPIVTQAASQLPFDTTDISDWTAEKVARHIRANKWDLCALDVLHNMAFEGERELSMMAQTLTAAAFSSRAHLIIGCHLNDKRADAGPGGTYPRPQMRDLRHSGMLVRLASNVCLLHRPQEKEDNGEITTSLEGFLHWDKARHGQPCMEPVTFVAKRMGFYPSGDMSFEQPRPAVVEEDPAPTAEWFEKWEREREAAA